MGGAKRGFITASYDEHEQYSTAIVTGAGVDTEHLTLRLLPVAVLSGKVLDEVGEGVRQATVSLYAEDRRVGIGRIQKIGQEQTDDRGTYEFARLNSGTYFVSVTGTPWYALHPAIYRQTEHVDPPPQVEQALDVAYPITYYKDATEADEASPIPVRGGDHLEVDIHVSPVQALHVLFHVPNNGENGYRFPTLQRSSFDGTENFQVSGDMVSPGLVEMTGVVPGRYIIRAFTSSPDQSPQTSDVEVNLDSNGEELDATKGEPASSLKASVKVLGEEKLPTQLVVLLRNRKLMIVAGESVNEKGEVEFQNVRTGQYELLAQAPGKAYSVLRISTAAHQISGHILDVSPGSSLDVSLTLVGSAVKVEGVAKASGKPMAGAMVVLVPKNPESNRELFRRDQTDLDGTFSLRGVIPGVYTVCAIQDGWDLDWAKSAVIAHYCEHGQRVVVSNQSAEIVTLKEAVIIETK